CGAVGDAGTVVTTSDGGDDWSTQPSGLHELLTMVSCPTTTRCYAAGSSYGRLFRFVGEVPPPVTSASLSTSGYHSADVYEGPVSITLTATGGDGGVADTFYRIDGGAQQTYGGAFSYDDEGSHTLSYWSTDTAGNAETGHSLA